MSELGFHHPGTNGSAVLLIHGLTGSPAEMRYVGKQLNRQGYTVESPLLAGHGQGLPELLASRWHDWYGTIETAYLQLRKTHAHVFVAGICAGGTLGLILAGRHRDVSGVTVFSPTLKYDGWNTPKLFRLSPLVPAASHVPFLRDMSFPETHPFGLKDDRLRARIEAGENLVPGSLDAFPLIALAQMIRMTAYLKRMLPKINVPTQLIHASEDDLSHPRNARKIAARIGGPVQIEWMENSYHMLHVDQERRKVAELTGRFFRLLSDRKEGADAA